MSVDDILNEEARILAAERRFGTQGAGTQEGTQGASLEDALIQKLSESSPVPGAHTPTPVPPPIVEPKELRPRSSNPPAKLLSDERLRAIPHLDPLTEEQIEGRAQPNGSAERGEEDDQPVREAHATRREPLAPNPARRPVQELTDAPISSPRVQSEKRRTSNEKHTNEKHTPLSSVARASHPPQSRNNTLLRWLAVLAPVALGAYVAVRMSLAQAPVEPSPTVESTEAPITVVYEDPPPSAALGENEGWLEVRVPEGTQVLVDGVEQPAGRVSVGSHDVRVGTRMKAVEVRASQTTRVDWP
jgi:hypothetical protein